MVRVFARIMLGLGVLGVLSGGIVLVSSVLMIAQGALWLDATKTAEALAAATVALQRSGGLNASCCQGTLFTLRSLAIAGIVFASLEILAGAGVGAGYGYTVMNERICGTGRTEISCAELSITADTRIMNIHPDTPLGVYLIYVAGNAFIAGPLNVAMSAATLQLLQLVASLASPKEAAVANPLAAAPMVNGWTSPAV